eukprot:g66527.t1
MILSDTGVTTSHKVRSTPPRFPGIENVLLSPNAPGLLQLVPNPNAVGPRSMFLYSGSQLPPLPPPVNFADKQEAWLYGAAIAPAGPQDENGKEAVRPWRMAVPTGKPDDVLKGVLFTFAKGSKLQPQLEVADGFMGCHPKQPHTHAVRRGMATVVTKDGTPEQAWWYFFDGSLAPTTAAPEPQTLSFEDAFNGSFSPQYGGMAWAKTKDSYYRQEEGNIVLYTLPQPKGKKFLTYFDIEKGSEVKNTENGTKSNAAAGAENEDGTPIGKDGERKKVLVQGQDVKWPTALAGHKAGDKVSWSEFAISADGQYVLFTTQRTQLYRHSFHAVFLILDLGSKQVTLLDEGKKCRLAHWSPRGHRLAYVWDNNVYLWDVEQGTRTAVSSGGKLNEIVNGVCDWVNEEEVFQKTSALYWAPDANSLAYLKFEEKHVKEYSFPVSCANYNKQFTYKYPKAGEANSVVKLAVYQLASGSTCLPDLGVKDDHYITSLAFWNNKTIVLRLMPRLQNSWALLRVELPENSKQESACRVSKLASDEHPCYVEESLLKGGPIFFGKENQFVDVRIEHDFKQLALFSAETGELVRFLTSEKGWGVDLVIGSSQEKRAVFYTSLEKGPMQRVLYLVNLDGVRTRLVPAAASLGTLPPHLHTFPDLSPPFLSDPPALWESASFSASANYFVYTQQGERPRSELWAIEEAVKGQEEGKVHTRLVRTLVNNSKFWEALPERLWPQRKFLRIPGAGERRQSLLNAYMWLPLGFDGHVCRKRYPVLVFQYSGPSSQLVTAKVPFANGTQNWLQYLAANHSIIVLGNHHRHHYYIINIIIHHQQEQNWLQYLAANHSIIVLVVDPVGTGGRGDTFQKQHTYMQLGKSEAEDLLAVGRWLRGQCWADPGKLALWGWSYGGFMATLLASTPGVRAVYSTLVAVAPVTDWRLYNTIYTERYMRTPQENEAGYSNTSILDRLRQGKAGAKTWVENFLLMHGTCDDNVHVQQSLLLTAELVEKGVQYESQIYTNRDHAMKLFGGDKAAPPNYHLYQYITRYLTRAFHGTTAG